MPYPHLHRKPNPPPLADYPVKDRATLRPIVFQAGRVLSVVEARSAASPATLTGLAVPYNRPARVTEHFDEQFAAGSFRNLKDDILAVAHHDETQVLGRTGNGTLRLEDRDDGLYASLDLPNTTLGKDLAALAERKDLGGWSVRFISEASRWAGKLRTITAATALHLSPVARPVYPTTLEVA